ncbi:MAG TPA: ABC transporter permease [Acidimicrobiales bacterium]|nr:ABC transporter permease [Acidimicrobiales bacterium]
MTGEVRGRRLAQLLLLVTLLGLWQLAAALDVASDRLLTGPHEVGNALLLLLGRGYFYENLWATLRVIGLGMGIALAGGVGLALAIGMVPLVRDGVYPFVVALNILPKVALVPLITISMGYSYNSRIVVVVLAAFFPMFINTLVALREAQEPRDRLMRSLGATRRQRLRMHVLPEGAPVIFAGIKLSLTVAFISAILAEFLIQRDGLAYLITAFRIAMNTEMMYAVTVAVAGLGMVMYLAVDRLERWIVHWEPSDRPTEVGAHG